MYSVIFMKQNQKNQVRDVQDALYVLGGKWKIPILFSLCIGKSRFTEIQKDVVGITPRMLMKELRELEMNELIFRKMDGGFPKYSFTEYGNSITPTLKSLQRWGASHNKKVKGKL